MVSTRGWRIGDPIRAIDPPSCPPEWEDEPTREDRDSYDDEPADEDDGRDWSDRYEPEWDGPMPGDGGTTLDDWRE
jgi:hypothetical protein